MKTIFGDVIYYKGNTYVIDKDNIRYMKFGLRSHGLQGAIHLSDPNIIVFDYMKCFKEIYSNEMHSKEKHLLLGLGAGTAINIIRNLNTIATIDVVEISEDVIDVSKSYFGVDEGSNVRIFEDDAVSWIKKTNSLYDVIFVDIYNTEGLPKEMWETEFHNNLNNLREKNSILIFNIKGDKEKFDLFTELIKDNYLGSLLHKFELNINSRGKQNVLFLIN